MIPKKIHYIWFGRNPLPELALKCIESWKKYCPDYEIIEWNEDNFDISKNLYAKQAYEAKKWAFVSDYARVKILYKYGGIYLDTDMEILKNIDKLINSQSFTSFEDCKNIAFGIYGSRPKSEILKILLDSYDDDRFILDNQMLNTKTIVTRLTDILLKYKIKLNGKTQITDEINVYSSDYFYPKNVISKEINITNNTYSLHHYDGSWLSDEDRKFALKKQYFIKKFGDKKGKIVYYLYFIFKNYQIYGLKHTVRIFIHKYKTSSKRFF